MPTTIVISAVNLVEGGTLTVLRDCLAAAESTLPSKWRLVALVNRSGLVEVQRTELIAFPRAKTSWLLRIWYEWFGFRALSRQLEPDLWLSLHDITPRVHARQQAVYCHNPAPFYKASWRESRLDYSFFLFNKLYGYLYGAFIARNTWVIVQQQWLRDAFKEMYGNVRVIVAHPHPRDANGTETYRSPVAVEHRPPTGRAAPALFFYPSFPRVYKNFEVLCEATKRLNEKGALSFRVQITVAGIENAYARELHARYGTVSNLEFIGLQNREQMAQRYAAADVVVFPGKLETWGLPISEAKRYGKKLLLADRPYAHETVGSYGQVDFFDATDAEALATQMLAILDGTWAPRGSNAVIPEAPFASDWPTLWRMLSAGLDTS